MIIMATKSTKTSKQTEKRAFTLTPEFSLWKKQDQNGKPYFSGKTEAGKYLVGFYNTKKKNPKEPDLRVYFQGDKGEELNTNVGYSIWHNVNEKTNKQYFSGVYSDEENEISYKVVGFISKSTAPVSSPSSLFAVSRIDSPTSLRPPGTS